MEQTRLKPSSQPEPEPDPKKDWKENKTGFSVNTFRENTLYLHYGANKNFLTSTFNMNIWQESFIFVYVQLLFSKHNKKRISKTNDPSHSFLWQFFFFKLETIINFLMFNYN